MVGMGPWKVKPVNDLTASPSEDKKVSRTAGARSFMAENTAPE